MSDLTENLFEEIAQARRERDEARAEIHAVCDERDRARRDREGLRAILEAERAKHTEFVAAIGALLALNGCSCDCGHDSEGHDDECERCLACQIQLALNTWTTL